MAFSTTLHKVLRRALDRISTFMKTSLKRTTKKTKTNLLDLPLEIRWRIAELVIPASLPDCYVHEGEPYQHFIKPPAFTQVNRILREETEGILIGALGGEYSHVVEIGRVARETRDLITAYSVTANLFEGHEKELKRGAQLSDQMELMLLVFAFGRGPFAMRMRKEGKKIEFAGRSNFF